MSGIILIIWGYRVNAANNDQSKKEEKKKKEVEKKPVSPFGSINYDEKAKKDTNTSKSEKDSKSSSTTVIETDKKAEEASATQ